MKVFLGSDKKVIEIEDTPSLGRGGEGEVYKVISPVEYLGYCVKLYNPNKISEDKIKKLEYLLTHNPITDSVGHRSVIWIENLVYLKSNHSQTYTFSGLLMPIAEGYSVEYLCSNKFPFNRIKSHEVPLYQKFDRNHPDSFKVRLAVCYNIAVAVAQLHQVGLYVHADIKPENIIFNHKGKVSIIDFDTVQVAHSGKTLFPALAQTPEYVPPMYQQKGLKNVLFSTFTDIFSITVIFYRILTGIHPFAATNFKAPYQNVTDIPTAIRHKLFPFGQKQSYFNQIPPPHQLFRKLPRNLQNLFIEVLEHENTTIKAIDWMEAIHPQKPKLFFPNIPLHKPNPSLSHESIIKYTFEPNPIIVLPTYIDNQYDKIQWMNEEDLKPSLIDSIFRSYKTRISNEIIYIQNACKELIQNYKQLKKRHSDMLIRYAEQTKSLAQKYQQEYTVLLNQYPSVLSNANIDELYYQTIDKIQQNLEQWLSQKTKQFPVLKEMLNSYLNELQKLNTTYIDPKHTQTIKEIMHTQKISFEQAKEKYINTLKQDTQQKITYLEQEIQKLRKNNNKIWEMHPWIQEQCSKTYISDAPLAPIIISRFEQAGFKTAADIIDIDEKGHVLNVKGDFIKIPQIGFARANEVWTWKNNVLKQLKKEAKKQNIDLTHFDTPEILAKKGEIDTLQAELKNTEFQIKNLHLNNDLISEQLTAEFWYHVFKITDTTLENLIQPTIQEYQQQLEKLNPNQILQKLKNVIDIHNEKQLEIKLYYENTHQDYIRQKTDIESKMQENLTRLKELWKNV